MRGGPMRAGGQRPNAGLGPQAQAALKRAYDLRASDPAASAADFERMAKIASDKSMPAMAAHLSVEAARSHHRAGNDDAGISSVKAGINYATAARAQGKVARRFSDLVADLREHGHAAAADQIEAEVKAKLGITALPARPAPQPMNRNQRRVTPTQCGTCGAPVDYDPEFDADGTADCRYCGVNLT